MDNVHSFDEKITVEKFKNKSKFGKRRSTEKQYVILNKKPPVRATLSQKRQEQFKTVDSRMGKNLNSKFNGISPIRSTGKKFTFSETGPSNVMKQVESYFSEEENLMMSQITPKKHKFRHTMKSHFSERGKSPINTASKEIMNTEQKPSHDPQISETDPKYNILIDKMELANNKISQLNDRMNSFMDFSEKEPSIEGSGGRKYSNTAREIPKLLAQTFDSAVSFDGYHSGRDRADSRNSNAAISTIPPCPDNSMGPTPQISPDFVPVEILNKFKREIENLRKENVKLKETILTRTEEANSTIMKLAQMKKQAEEKAQNASKMFQSDMNKDKIIQEQNQVIKDLKMQNV